MTVAALHDAVGLRSVVERGLGLIWQLDADGPGLDALVGLALRDNPLRAQLVVSRVLGKHLPVAPAVAVDAAGRLAGLVSAALPPGPTLVLGFCETATSLGHLVAEALEGAHYAHTTRRPDPAVPATAGFDEEHSHAMRHVLQLRDPAVLADPSRPVVLVDDELSTGTTALNTIAALHSIGAHDRYVVATLLDLRPPPVRAAFAARAERMGVDVQVVALLTGALELPADIAERAAGLRRELADVAPAPAPRGRGRTTALRPPWPADLPLGGRTGTTIGPAALRALEDVASAVAPRLSGGPLLVLGTEELMWAPLRLAALLPGSVFHSTTRSPVLAADLPGYAVRRALLFPAPDEPGRTSRLHGLPDGPYADVVVVVDTPAEDAVPLAEALRPWASEAVHVVSL